MIKIEELLKQGSVNVFETEKEDEKVLLLIFKDKNFIINLIQGKISSAYVDDSLTEKEIKLVSDIISDIYDNKFYEGFRRFGIKLKSETKEEFCKTITRFVPPKAGNKGDGAEKILADNGYFIEYPVSMEEHPERSYEELLKTDEFAKMLVEDNITKLKEENIPLEFDAKDKDVQESFRQISLVENKCPGIIFTGPTGTGKSVLATIMAAKLKAPLLTYQITAGTQVEDLEGKYAPNDNKDEANSFTFVEGPLLEAYYKGYIFGAEEVNAGMPGILALFNRYTDGSSYVKANNGKIYKKHPNFVVLMTMNPGYDGTECLNMALKNRFSVCHIPKLDLNKYSLRCKLFCDLLGHSLPVKFYEKLYSFSDLIEKEGKKPSWNENIAFSFRNARQLFLNILTKKCNYQDFKAAFNINYLNLLCMDSDNSEKLQNLKNNEEIEALLKELYDLYDYKETPAIKPEIDLEVLLRDESDEVGVADSDPKKVHSTIDTDALFSRFGD